MPRLFTNRDLLMRAAPFAVVGIAAIVLAATHLRASAADYSDLVLSLTFDHDNGNTAVDSSRYQNNGTATGTTLVDGKHGSARQFNGASDAIVVPHADSLMPTNAITVESWVYLDGSGAGKILQKRGVFSNTSGGYMLGAWFGNPQGYGFEVYDPSDAQHIVNPSPEHLPATQTWTHVASTFDGSSMKLYENGQLVGTTAYSGTIGRSTKDLSIGVQPDNGLMPFKGKLDDLKIYNRALTADEIACDMNGNVWASGSCQTSANRPPIVVSASGPSAALSGTAGQWIVKGYDPDGGALTFKADWGEGTPEQVTSSSSDPNQSATFSHTYAAAGSFTPKFIVADASATSAAVAVTVTVAAPTTRVSGGIYDATTWAKARNPYVIADDVTVFPGVTLTVEPGVEVRAADGKKLVIRGNLIAEGTSSDHITFTADRASPAKGAWGGIQIQNQQGGKASLKFADVRYAQTGLSVECCSSGGPVTIADATFRDNTVALGGYAGWKEKVDRTTFENNTNAVTQADKDIADSTFRNNTYGLYQTERISVYRSTFTGHTVAAWGGRGDFKQNTVTNNEIGVQAFFEGWKTTYNTITNNGVGIIIGQYDSTTPEISSNNITANTTYDAKVTGASNKTAANNWWGTTDATVIDQKTYDGRDDASLGLLTTKPILTQAVDITNLVVPDTQAPGAPTNLTVANTTRDSVELRWTGPTDNVGVTRYDIRVRTNWSATLTETDWPIATAVASPPLPRTPGEQVAYTFTGLTENVWYSAGVKACDAAGNCSPIGWATFRTTGGTTGSGADTTPPGAVTNFSVAGVGGRNADITWVVPSDNVGVVRFEICYRTGVSVTSADCSSGTTIRVTTVPAPGTSTTYRYDMFWLPDTDYAFGIRACDAAGNCSPLTTTTFRTILLGGVVSPPPATTSGTTGGADIQAPGIPTYVTAEEITASSARIAWVAPADNVGVTSYEVRYRQGTSFANVDWVNATATGSIPSTVAAGQRVSTVLSGLTVNTDYGAGVKACDAAGNCSTIAAAMFRTTGTTTGATFPTGSASITGRVLKPDGSAVASGPIVKFRAVVNGTYRDVQTNADGRFYLTNIGAGSFEMLVYGVPTGTSAPATTTITIAEGQTVTRDILLIAAGTSGGTGGTTSTTTTTGTTGGGTGTTTTTTGTTVTTTGTATLRVTVRDGAGKPVSGAIVGIAFSGGANASPATTTGADGVVTFTNVAAGSYYLGASPPADRADLGSITAFPIALAIGATREESVVLPARITGERRGGDAGSLCGTVGDPDRRPLSGITVGVSSSAGTSGFGMSTTTGADGRYCFTNLAPGTYVVGAATPASRTDLSPPGTTVVSLAAGTVASQDLVFFRAAPVTPGTTVATPASAPLPAIERCVRDVLGADVYEGMRTGKRKPSAEEYGRARACFALTVIGESRPVASPIGAPTVPSSVSSVIVLPATTPAVAPPAAPPPTFDDRCEVRELPRVKRDLKRVERELAGIEREVDRLRTAKVAVPTDVGLLTARVHELIGKVQAATTCEDAFSVGEELPDLTAQLRTSVERVSRLRFAPRILATFDREVRRLLESARTGIRRLERASFTVTEFSARLAEVEQQLKDCRVSAAAALDAIDPELFEDTMHSCFDILDEGREVESLTGALANARAFLTGRVTIMLTKATRVARDLERQKKDAAEVRQYASTLQSRRDEALTGIGTGKLKRDELADALQGVIGAIGDLDDAFHRALGTSTFASFVGQSAPSIATPKLEKPAEDFFTRE